MDDVSDNAIRQARQEEARLRSITTHEEAVLIDRNLGDVIWRKVGEAQSVVFTDDEIRQMAGQVLTHNHPAGWRFAPDDPRRAGSSYSPADIAIFVEGRLAEMRVVSPRYIHTLRPPAFDDDSSGARYFRTGITSLSFAEIKDLVSQIGRAIRAHLRASLEQPALPGALEQVEANLWHEVACRLAGSWGVDYRREELRP